jgi:5-methylcytosine-specific restriction endonuclease McrA
MNIKMPRKPVIFLEKTYKTQGEFDLFVRKLIYDDIGVCDDVKNLKPNHYNMLIEILKRHPDFISKTQNMCNLKIVKDALNRDALKILIMNTYMSETDISWKCAITGKHKSDKNELMSAMRSSIDEQIFQFRKTNLNKCVLCPNTDKLHVDHIIHFDEIVFNFIKIMKSKNIEIPNNFGETDDNTHRRCFLEIDNNFKNEWVNYHFENATLQMLCQSCNLKRTKTKCKI